MQKKTAQTRVDILDGVRALATLLVMAFHYWQQSWVSPVVRLGPLRLDFSCAVLEGYYGVVVLFVLSGFGLYLSTANAPEKPFSLKQYALRRVARIVPTYYLCVALGTLVQIGRVPAATLRAQCIANLTFTQMATPALANNIINGVLWSIAIEVQFYLLFPLLRLAMKKRPALTVLAAIALGQGARTAFTADRFVPTMFFHANQLLAHIDLFVIGMFAAHLHARIARTLTDEQKTSLRGAFTAAALTGLMLVVLAWMYTHTHRYDDRTENLTRLQLQMRLFVGLGTALFIVCGDFGVRALHAVFGGRVARFLGGLSYQIYLWHMWLCLRLKDLHIPSYATERPMDDTAWRLPFLLLSIALTFAVSIAMTYGVEKPAAKRLLRAKR